MSDLNIINFISKGIGNTGQGALIIIQYLFLNFSKVKKNSISPAAEGGGDI